MASNVIRATLLADAQRFKAGFKEAETATDSFGKKTANVGKVVASALAVAAVGAVKAFVGDSVRAFSELEQSVGGTEAVFGDASGSIDTFAKKSADAIGLSEAEFRTATTSIGGQLKRMTGDVDLAAKQSINLTQVAADLAATYGGTTAEAVDALGSAFRGEADPAERFNLNLKAGAVAAKAVEMGLAASAAQVDDNAKAQATLALIMEQSADAQGQFAEEADTVAGKTERANAAIENQKAVVGEALVPVKQLATELGALGAKTLGVLATGFLDLTGQISDTEAAIQEFRIHTGDAADSLTAAVTINQEYGTSFRDLFREMEFAEDALQPLTDSQKAYLTQLGYTTEEIAELDGLIHGYIETQRQAALDVARGRGREEEYAAALEATGRSADMATGALERHAEEIRAQLDPVFAARQAERELAAAMDAVTTAATEHGEGSPEHIAALEDATEASLDLRAAQEAVSDTGGLTRDEFIKQQVELGRTKREAELLADEYDHLFTPRTVQHTINIRENVATGRVGGGGIAGHRQHGGRARRGHAYVVGEDGEEVFVPDEDGEIIPSHKVHNAIPALATNNEIPPVVNIHLTIQGSVVTERDIVDAVHAGLLQKQRRTGRLGLT